MRQAPLTAPNRSSAELVLGRSQCAERCTDFRTDYWQYATTSTSAEAGRLHHLCAPAPCACPRAVPVFASCRDTGVYYRDQEKRAMGRVVVGLLATLLCVGMLATRANAHGYLSQPRSRQLYAAQEGKWWCADPDACIRKESEPHSANRRLPTDACGVSALRPRETSDLRYHEVPSPPPPFRPLYASCPPCVHSFS